MARYENVCSLVLSKHGAIKYIIMVMLEPTLSNHIQAI
jgi:hypothetical protein